MPNEGEADADETTHGADVTRSRRGAASARLAAAVEALQAAAVVAVDADAASGGVGVVAVDVLEASQSLHGPKKAAIFSRNLTIIWQSFRAV